VRRGELYRVRKPGVFVIVSRQVLLDSRYSTAVCAPVFTHGEDLATQVPVGMAEGLKHKSWITCDNLVSLKKSDLTDFVGRLGAEKLAALNRGLRVALDLG
jgi:mRNA interferase MazF